MDAAVHAGGERAALEAVAAERRRASKPAAAARAWTMRATVPGSMAAVPTRGRGVCRPSRPRGGDQNPPEHRAFGDAGRLLPAPQRAHRAEFGRAVGDGDGDAAPGAFALGARQGEAQPALARSRCSTRIAGQFGAAQGPGKADQQQGAVAQACEARGARQIIGDGGEDLAQDVGGGGELLGRQLACVGGVATHAGHGRGDLGLGGGHRAAGR